MEEIKTIKSPHPLTSEHDVSDFNSKSDTLNKWLKEKALKSQEGDTAKTYVVTVKNKVIGYYCLAASSVVRVIATSKVKRNVPDPIPCMLIGRLAVDIEWEGRGIGSGLLRDAIFRTLNAAEIAGIKCILVHAKDEESKNFYIRHRFEESPLQPLTLMMTLKNIRASLLK